MIILVGIGGFVLGRLSYTQTATTDVVLQPLDISARTDGTAHKQFYASKRGSAFYPWWCEAGSSIKEENKIYFTSKEQAEAEGYQRTKRC